MGAARPRLLLTAILGMLAALAAELGTARAAASGFALQK